MSSGLGRHEGLSLVWCQITELSCTRSKTLGLRGKGIGSKIKGIVSLLTSCLQALWLLITNRPSVVVGFGGYAAGPAGIVAWLLRIPVVIHEQNAVAGTTNRLLSRVAKRVLAGFDGAFASSLPVLATGNPVRSTLANVPSKAYPQAGFSEVQPLKLAILGGSQGALALNRGVPMALSKLSGNVLECITVRHQCGRNHYDATASAWSAASFSRSRDHPVLSTIWPSLYQWADVAICRAGALTVL